MDFGTETIQQGMPVARINKNIYTLTTGLTCLRPINTKSFVQKTLKPLRPNTLFAKYCVHPRSLAQR